MGRPERQGSGMPKLLVYCSNHRGQPSAPLRSPTVCDGTARSRCVGECIQPDEIVYRNVIPDAGVRVTCVRQFAGHSGCARRGAPQTVTRADRAGLARARPSKRPPSGSMSQRCAKRSAMIVSASATSPTSLAEATLLPVVRMVAEQLQQIAHRVGDPAIVAVADRLMGNSLLTIGGLPAGGHASALGQGRRSRAAVRGSALPQKADQPLLQ